MADPIRGFDIDTGPKTPRQLREEINAYRADPTFAAASQLDGWLDAMRDLMIFDPGSELNRGLAGPVNTIALASTGPAHFDQRRAWLLADALAMALRRSDLGPALAIRMADDLALAIDAGDRRRALAGAQGLAETLSSEGHAEAERVRLLFDWTATLLYGHVAMWAVDPDPDQSASDSELARSGEQPDAERMVVMLVESLAGDLDRLRQAVPAAEVVANELAGLADRLSDAGDDEAAAVVARQAEAISALAKSGSPPPRSFSAAMLDGQELLHRYRGSGELEASLSASGVPDDQVAQRAAEIEQMEATFEMPPDDDGAGYSNAIAELARFGESLPDDGPSPREEPSRLRKLTVTGAEDGFKKLVAGVVATSPYTVYKGLAWLMEHHSWLAAMYRFAIAIVKARPVL